MARSLFRAALGWCAAACLGSQAFAAELDRTILPIPEPQRPTYTEVDVRNVKAPPRFEVKAPAGAPNVVIVLKICSICLRSKTIKAQATRTTTCSSVLTPTPIEKSARATARPVWRSVSARREGAGCGRRDL